MILLFREVRVIIQPTPHQIPKIRRETMKKLYVNIDINSIVTPFLDRTAAKPDYKTKDLYPFVDQYLKTHTTDLLFCTFCQYSATDSVFWSTYADKYEQTEENGVPVDYKDSYTGIYKIHKEYGDDPYDVWFKRCKEIGINAWLSVRMNDCHRNGNSDPYFLYSDFLYEAEEKGWTLGDEYGRYYGRSFDYGVKEVRDKYLGYIKEQLERYDVYGIELDYMREPMCVKYGTTDKAECIATMTNFMREAKKIVTDCEKLHGHKIKIAVRVPRDYEQRLYHGFDAVTWASEGLIDVLIPTPRFASSDNGIPVAEWKKLAPHVELAPGIETPVVTVPDRQGFMSAATARGSLASFVAQGADSLYTFNYFMDPADSEGAGANLEAHLYSRSKEVLTSCNGEYEDMLSHPTRFAVIWQENNYFPFAHPLWKPIPKLIGDTPESFEVTTGNIPEDKSIRLVMGFDSIKDGMEVSINGNVLSCGENVELTNLPGIGAQPENYTPEGTKCKLYVIDKNMLTELTQTVTVRNADGVTVHWVEIYTY